VNGVFESREVIERGDQRLGISVCGTKGILTIRYTGHRDLRICRDFPVPMEDQSHFEVVTPPEDAPIPDAVPLEYRALGINPDQYYNLYFAENNRRAAWNLLRAIEGKESLTAGLESALESLEMITGAYQSALTHAPISFPLVNRRNPLAVNEKK
jgi:hypothetical protein